MSNTETFTEQTARTEQGSAPTGEPIGESAALTRTGAMGFGLVPRTFDEGWRMATVFAKSALVPKPYQGKPEDIIIAMQYGAEVGLPPMAALQSVAVINGKPGLYGDGFLGVIMSKPAYLKHVEYYELTNGTRVKSLSQADYANDETKAVAIFWRKGNPEPFVSEFSIGDAKRAKLWGKEGPWTNYPARQLKWRARGFAGRDGFAAELRGVKMAEELLDIPIDAEFEVTSQPITEPVRRSEKPATEGATDTTAPEQPTSSSATDHPLLTNELPPAADKGAAAKPAGRGTTTRAAATTRPVAGTSSPDAGPSVVTRSMVITNFQYCTPRDQDPYYEITARVKKPGEAPMEMAFITRNEALAKLAASCEGTDAVFNIAWHGGKRAANKPCKILESIESAT